MFCSWRTEARISMPGNCGVSELSYIIKLKESIAADFFFIRFIWSTVIYPH